MLSCVRTLTSKLRLNILTKPVIASTCLFVVMLSSVGIAASQTTQSTPAPPAPGTQTPGTQNVSPPNEPVRRGGFVPGQKRPPGDPVQIARGKTLFAINCRGCHGADLRGGDLGGPNLLRSQVALSDLNGELIVPIIHGSRQNMGMPAIGLNDADANAVAAYVRSVIETIQNQGAPPSAGREVPSILIGNASEGKAYFATKCSGCHSATNDLSKIASRIPDPKRLQDAWLAGGTREEESEGAASTARTVTATISLPSGETVEGKLVRVDDFFVTLALADGSQKTFRRNGDTPNVVIHDPLKVHRDLLSQYSDQDIHDVTAYLVTLK
jgi:cytochrome c oxidase cbb3-type subunit 3